jgi:DNA-nicking Smr family endonuclease
MTRRRLSDEEHTLWSGVTRSITPLRTRPEPVGNTPAAATAPKPSPRSKTAVPVPAAAPKPPAPPVLSPLGRRFRQRVARGSEVIEDRIDLHGLTQARAHDALLRFLRTRHSQGVRTALIITGKGTGDAFGERGVLKRQVPMWLRTAEFRGFIIGFEDAGLRHGGEGALYVRLRRPRGE